jgi:hypothetical protein
MLPVDAKLKFHLTNGGSVSAAGGANPVLEVYAGVSVASVSIEVTGNTRFDVKGASVKVITRAQITRQEAGYGACLVDVSDIDASKADLKVLTQLRMFDSRDVQQMQSTMHDPFTFYEGGMFTVCYSDDSSFGPGHVDVHPVQLKILGGSNPCTSANCLASTEYYCYAMHKDRGVAGNCAVDLGIVSGKWDRARGSVSERFAVEYGGDGKMVGMTERPCATTGPDSHVLCSRDAACTGTDRTTQPSIKGIMSFTGTRALGSIRGETLAACYCPASLSDGSGRCSSNSHFTQQVGKVYFFLAVASISTDKMCVNFENYVGTKGFSGVLSLQPFVVCIHCPPGGCAFEDLQSRVKMVPHTQFNDVPSWLPEHGCRSAPPSRYIRPLGKQGFPTLGGRADYKFFAQPNGAGFTLPFWPRFERIGEVLDICMCLINCTLTRDIIDAEYQWGWFKIGQLDVVEPALTQGSTVTYKAGEALINEVGVPGFVGLDRHLLPYGNPDVLGLHKKGGLRLAPWDRDNHAALDEACSQETDPNRVVGLTEANAFTDRIAEIYPTVGEPSRLLFNGGDNSRTITVTKTGLLAVCYCPMSSAGKCMEPSWVQLAVVMVAGPAPGQSWVLPTYRIARFEYRGFDLRPTDTLTLVPEGSSCNADPAWSQGTGVITSCPRGSHRLCELGYQKAMFSASTLGHDSVGCNSMNADCQQSYVRRVDSYFEGIYIVFTKVPSFDSGLGELGLTDGDTVVMGSGITCKNHLCSQKILDEVKGFRAAVGLQTYIDLNEGSGTTANDRIGYFNGALLQGPTWIDGKYGKGLRFDSAAQSVFVHQDVVAFNSDLPWSLLAWVRPAAANWHTIFGIADANGIFESGELLIGISGYQGAQGALYIEQVGTVDGLVSDMAAATSLTAGVWNHVAVTYSGSKDGTVSFFINGALSYTRHGVVLEKKMLPTLFGGGIDSSRRTAGSLDLDELRFYNTPLTEVEIQEVQSAADPSIDKDIQPGVPLGNIANRAVTNAKEFSFDLSYERTEGMMPTFKVNNKQGMWRRTNRAVTKAELLATTQQKTTVCWNREGRSFKAGELSFEHSTQLSGVGMYLTIDEPEKSAPFIITFGTAPASSRTGKRYAQAEGPMTLELLLLNTDQFDIQYSDLDGQEIPIHVPEADEVHEASQVMCGRLFRELYSSDVEQGFPMPRGCYLRTVTSFMREIVMVFEPRNGLRGGQTYQIVMNGRGTSSFTPAHQHLVIQTGDDILTKLHESVEIGHAYPNKDFKIAATPNDPRFATSDGIAVSRGFSKVPSLNIADDGPTELVELKSHESFQLRIKGDQFTGKIKRNNQLRIWLWPLTAWDVPESCAGIDKVARKTAFRVQCSVYLGRNKRCGLVTECQGYRTAPSGSVNTLLLTLPDDMSDLFGNIQYQLDFTEVPIPPRGFLPTRFGAQISKADDSKPYYVLTSGSWVHVPTAEGLTVGKLLSTDGNSKPFRGSSDNLLFVRFIPSLTVRSMWVGTSPPSMLGIMAPEGFKCLGASQARFDDLPQFVQGAGAPSGAGMPLPLSAWQFEERTCLYKVPIGAAVFSGTSFIVGVRVANPDLSLPVVSPDNKWTLLFSSAGYHNKTLKSNITFASYGDEQSASQLPVLGKLANVLVQPSNFSLSPAHIKPADGAPWVDQYLSFFLQTDTSIGELGSIGVEAPEGYEFGKACVVVDLEDEHYATGHEHKVHRLPGVRGCDGKAGDPSLTNNLIRIYLKGPLSSKSFYGFRVRVRNPQLKALPTQKRKWYFYTIDRDGNSVDGALADAGVPLLPGIPGQFQPAESMISALPFDELEISDANISGASVRLVTMFPTGNMTTNATVLMRLPVNLSSTLRVAAPHGFVWNASTVRRWEPPINASWNASGNETVPLPPIPDFPGVPDLIQSAGEVIVFNAGHFKQKELYGFIAEISVPAKEATTSSRVFYLEFGHSQIPRPISAIVPLGGVRAIRNSGLRTMNHVAGAHTELLVHVETVTIIDPGGALVIDVPKGFVFEKDCGPLVSWPRPWPRLSPALQAASCKWEPPYLVIRASKDSPILPELHRFRVKVTNPDEVILRPDEAAALARGNASICGFNPPCWKFSTHAACPMGDEVVQLGSSDCKSENNFGPLLDTAQYVEGFPIADAMLMAGLIDYRPGRDDRPQRINQIRIRFRLGGPQEVYGAGQLQLQGPEGFIFEPHCLRFVETRRAEVFGSDREGETWGVDAWEQEAAIVDCHGSGDTVVLDVLAGLRADKNYAFQIQVLNPEIDPSWNFWTLTFLGQKASKPFRSFPLWTFHDLSLQPLSPNKGPSCYDEICFGAGAGVGIPVRILLRPVHDVTKGGMLEVTAPQTFRFKTEPSPLTGRKDATPCMIRTLQEDADALDWMEIDRDCLVEPDKPYKMRMVVQSDYSLDPDHIHELFLYVLPPSDEELPQSWGLVSVAPNGEKLDIGSVIGYQVGKVLRQFEHTNVEDHPGRPTIVIAGREEVTDFFLDMMFPENLNPSDTLVVEAPPGFDLTGEDHYAWERSRIEANSTSPTRSHNVSQRVPSSACLGFRYEMPDAMLTNTMPECRGNQLTATFNLTSPIQSGILLRMRFRLFNPEQSPVREKNYWKIVHTSITGNLVGAAAIPSWNIVPRLDSATATLTGTLKSGGSVSAVTLQFRTILAFTEVRIRALSPVGFTLARANPLAKVNGVSTATQVVFADANYIVLAISSDGQDILELELQNIVLPVKSGLSQWYVSTYEENTQLSRGEPRIRDEVRFTGFLAPGHLKIGSVKLSSTADSVDKHQGVLLKSKAVAHINVTVSTGTMVNDALHIELKGGGEEGFQCHIPEGVQVFDDAGSLVPTTLVQVLDEWMGDAPARGLVLLLGSALQQDKVYTISIPVVTPMTTEASARERWHLNIFRKGLPEPPLVATNDGVSPLIHLVMQLLEEPRPFAPRAPPLSRAEVQIRLDPITSGASAFIVTAPIGFTIPEDCGPLYGAEGVPPCLKSGSKEERMNCGPPFPNITHCIGSQSGPNGEYQARFICGPKATDDADAKILCRPSDVRFWVLMPKYNLAKADNWWMIEGIDIIEWNKRLSLDAQFTQVGWVRMQGFDLVQMSTEIWYGEASDIPVDVVVQFTNTMDIRRPGAEVILYSPPSIKLDCDDVETLQPELRILSLPGLWDKPGQEYAPCRADMDGGWIALRLNNSLPKDTYVFTVRVQSPVIDPPTEQNYWSLWLRDVDGHIIETVVDSPGQNVIYGARAAADPVEWAPIAPMATVFHVTVRLEVLDEFDAPISALLIQLPMNPGRRHAIERPEDLRVLKARGPGLPLANGVWSDFSNPNRIYVYLDPKTRLRSGLYGISFPVHLLTPEEELPRFNVWQLAMCSNSNMDVCTVGSTLRERGDIVTSFAMGGFNERDTYNGDKPVWKSHQFAVASDAFRLGSWLVLCSATLLGLT